MDPVRDMIEKVADAEQQFRARWSRHALRKINADLAQKVERQQEKWAKAAVTAEPHELMRHGRAMLKGWGAARRAMSQGDVPHDAYTIGVDPKTGLTVAIGEEKGSKAVVEAVLPISGVVHITPDEVATMVAGLGLAAQIKQAIGGEIVGVTNGEDEAEQATQEAQS